MQCLHCQADNREGRRFCGECGAALALVCSACSFANDGGEKFCGGCGAPLSATPASAATPSPPAPTFHSPQSYTPQHLAERIISSRGALEGERKQVTVLFADLKGSMELLADRDPEDARKILDPVLERMMDAVHHYEGTVNQVMGDGIMALFGAPLAHEDHAVRACYAALRMQDSIARYAEEVQRTEGLPVQIRVGLNSGEVVVRSIGSDLRMDYTAVGQTTSLAARMEQLAMPGSIMVAPATLRLAEGQVQVRPRGPMQVKGLAEPVEVHELTGAGPTRSRLHAAALRGLTRFVGRETEMATLRQALARAGAGHGQLVAAVGEPGVGKSRLLWELARSHHTQGWLGLESSSVSYGKATPYLPVSDLLRGYFQLDPTDGPRRIRQQVLGKVLDLDEALRPLLPALLTLLDVPVDDASWQGLEPAERRRQTAEAVKRLLLRESQVQPVLVLFEDLHWIDGETQALLDHLVESLPTARLLLLTSYRPEYQHGWGGKTYYTQLRLDPLPPESAEEILDALLGTDPGLHALKRLLIARTEGTPFFLEESVRTLVESGALSGERGVYRLARAVPDVQVPATVQAVLAARIDRLMPADKRVLQSGAVIGHELPLSLLLAIAEGGEDQLRASLARLQEAEFLYEASLFPELEYTFKHALTHEVAYGSLLHERRRALHAQIAEAMESLYAGRLGDHVERLAQHAYRGELGEKAVGYLEQAASKAVARSAYVDAGRLLEQALEVQQALAPDDTTRRCDLLLAQGEAILPSEEPQQAATRVASEAFALAVALGDPPRAARAAVLALEAHLRAVGISTLFGRTAEFQEWLARADQYAVVGTVDRVYADAYLGMAGLNTRGPMAGHPLLRRAVERARQLDDPRAFFLAAAYGLRFLQALRDREMANLLADEFLRRPRAGAPAGHLGLGLRFVGELLLERGDRAGAERVWGELRELAERTRDATLAVLAMAPPVVLALVDGRLEEAVAAFEAEEARADELGVGAGAGGVPRIWARALLHLGQGSEAPARFEDPSRPVQAAWAVCLAHLGRHQEARAIRERFGDVGSDQDESSISILTDLLEAAVLGGDRDTARALVRRLAPLAPYPFAKGPGVSYARLLGGAAALLGEREQGHAYYQQALEVCGPIRFRPEIALTHLQLAELLLQEGEEGGSADRLSRRQEALGHLDFAIEELRAMKMQPYLDRALAHRALLHA